MEPIRVSLVGTRDVAIVYPREAVSSIQGEVASALYGMQEGMAGDTVRFVTGDYVCAPGGTWACTGLGVGLLGPFTGAGRRRAVRTARQVLRGRGNPRAKCVGTRNGENDWLFASSLGIRCNIAAVFRFALQPPVHWDGVALDHAALPHTPLASLVCRLADAATEAQGTLCPGMHFVTAQTDDGHALTACKFNVDFAPLYPTPETVARLHSLLEPVVPGPIPIFACEEKTFVICRLEHLTLALLL
jgi:hypothetical protein